MIGGKECPECSEKGFACIRQQRSHEIGRSIKGRGKGRMEQHSINTTMALTVEQAKTLLKPVHAAYGQALATANLEAVGNFYSNDGVLIHKGKTCAYGRDPIRKALEPFCVPSDTTISDEVYETTSDHIVYKATFKSIIKSNGAEIGGKFEQIFRKEGDQWLIIYDEFEA